ncbi:MAG: DNA-binding protein [Bacteroidia bacterium]|nr:DNA-binding protein [Bacteroidia bacterium]
MSLYYDLYPGADIQQTGEEQPLYPRVVAKGTIEKEEFLEHVSRFCHLNKSVLAGAMDAFQSELKELLANGWNVSLGDIGYFSLSLEGPKVMSKEEVRAYSIDLKNINFRVNKTFKKEVRSQMKLERKTSLTRPEASKYTLEECRKMLEEFLKNHPFITREVYCRLTENKKERALKELNTFIEAGVLERHGAGRTVIYMLKQPI